MKLVGTVVGLSVVSGFPTFNLFNKNKEKKANNPVEVYDVDFDKAFAQMDQALNRAFAIPILEAVPILEADVYHMPDGNQFMTPLRRLESPLRQFNNLNSIFGFPMSSPLSSPLSHKNERFLKLGDTDDLEEKSHDDESHATTTKHKITQNMLDRLTGKSGLKTTKTTDIVSDDGHSQVHMVVSSFDMGDEQNGGSENEDDEKDNVGHKKYSVEAEKVFNGKIRPGKTYGFSDEDLKEREFERQKYVDNMINKWHSLLNGPFGFQEDNKVVEELDDLESIMKQKKELEEKLKQLNSAEKMVREKLVEVGEKEETKEAEAEDKVAEKSGEEVESKIELEVEPKVKHEIAEHEVVPDKDHVTFTAEKYLEDEREDVEAEQAQEVKTEKYQEDSEKEVFVIEPVKSLKSLKKKVSKHSKKRSSKKHKKH